MLLMRARLKQGTKRGSPPETGASIMSAPAPIMSPATSRATSTSSVVPSTHSVLSSPSTASASPARRPPSPWYTARTCGDDGSIVTTVPAARITSAGAGATSTRGARGNCAAKEAAKEDAAAGSASATTKRESGEAARVFEKRLKAWEMGECELGG
jgi:hypothetical protein